jgi:hypothetical protein
MEERDDLVRFGIYPRKVRAFVEVAAVASECEIGLVVGAAVLACDDVFDLQNEARMFLV